MLTESKGAGSGDTGTKHKDSGLEAAKRELQSKVNHQIALQLFDSLNKKDAINENNDDNSITNLPRTEVKNTVKTGLEPAGEVVGQPGISSSSSQHEQLKVKARADIYGLNLKARDCVADYQRIFLLIENNTLGKPAIKSALGQVDPTGMKLRGSHSELASHIFAYQLGFETELAAVGELVNEAVSLELKGQTLICSGATDHAGYKRIQLQPKLQTLHLTVLASPSLYEFILILERMMEEKPLYKTEK